MKKPRPIEFECEACKGTGFPPVQQPEPGRGIYPRLAGSAAARVA